jgi:hypothetical protein
MLSLENKQFISEHLHCNVNEVALLCSKNSRIDTALVIRQIAGRKKMQKKVPLFFENDEILYPSELSAEQASSEIAAKYKAELLRGETFADLTGGLGVDCFFISKKFKKAFYVEKNSETAAAASHNFKVLQADNIEVVNADSELFLQNSETFDAVFIDPSRRNDAGKKVFLLSQCQPNISKMLPNLAPKSKNILLKLSPLFDISQAVAELPGTCAVHIISVDNDCKEILLEIQKTPENDLTIKAIHFIKNSPPQIFTFGKADEKNAKASFACEIKRYLYEPNPSVMKAGAFKIVSERFGIEKLDVNTHLYTSEKLASNFPGRIFEVWQTLESSKQTLGKLKNSYPKANIALRNYPATVAELRRKTGIDDGGETFIFGCVAAGKKVFVVCRKMA